jgi:D-sedoheptulose 7-phosphate isomerase
MTNLIDIFHTTDTKSEFAAEYFNYLGKILQTLETKTIEEIIDTFLVAAANDNVIYFIGNGGSAVTATHFASDMAINTIAEGNKPIRAISLTDNQALLTCVSNDEGFEYVFVRQLEMLMRPGDVVVGLSVSGNSPNVVHAFEYAKNNGGKVIACTGFDGGRCGEMADIHFHIPTPVGEYGPVEDIFQMLDHLIYTYLRLSRVGSLAHQA